MATLLERIDGATKVPRFESYRGFLFGSLNPDVPSLEEHLGGAKAVIDQIVDGAPDGIEASST